MNNKLEIFEFEDKEIRTQVDSNGNPWFCVKDVCKVLGLGNPTKTIENLDIEDILKLYIIDSIHRSQLANFVNEVGLFQLIFQSRKKEAINFKKWVILELLPLIKSDYINKLIEISNNTIKIEQSTYLMYNKTNNLTKIGRSYDVFERRKQLDNIFQNNEIILLGYVKDRDIELILHHNYAIFRVFGEWFDLEECIIKELMLDNNFINLCQIK